MNGKQLISTAKLWEHTLQWIYREALSCDKMKGFYDYKKDFGHWLENKLV
jgi:hypothetical protein